MTESIRSQKIKMEVTKLKPIDRKQIVGVIEIPTTKSIVLPHAHVRLVAQDLKLQGLTRAKEFPQVSADRDSVLWSPRADLVEYLAGLTTEDLVAQGQNSVLEMVITGYVGNMLKLGTIAETFSGVIVSSIEKDLPPKFSQYLKGYMYARMLSQEALAEDLHCSQSLISNSVTNKSVSALGFSKLIQGLDIEDETREAVLNHFISRLGAVPTSKRGHGAHWQEKQYSYSNLESIKHRSRWVDDLYGISPGFLESTGFNTADDFLLTRYLNTTSRLVRILNCLDVMPDEISADEMLGKVAYDFAFPSPQSLDRKNRTMPVLTRIWSNRGLLESVEHAAK